MTEARVERVRIWRVRVPLNKPYPAAIAILHAFDTLLVEVWSSDGSRGLGETTIITGYTPETVEGGLAFCKAVAREIVGLSFAEAQAVLSRTEGSQQHAVSAVMVALETAYGFDWPSRDREVRIPIVAGLSGDTEEDFRAAAEPDLLQGHNVFKMKVGWRVEDDIVRVRNAQRALEGRGLLRIDANQGFSPRDAIKFVESLDPAGVALFEQPCNAGDWVANAQVAACCPVPLMLDESIYGRESVERAAKIENCGFIKLKLAKCGGLRNFRENVALGRSLGLSVIVGNGATTDLGCLIEAVGVHDLVTEVGEMNGFLRCRFPLLAKTLDYEAGHAVIPPHWSLALDNDRIEDFDHVTFEYGART